jgi:uncharacterized protein YndB with AHSA1/START domain
MSTLNFSVKINAPREKVWEKLWGNDTYPQWTAPFCEGSHAVSEWKEGDPILFLTPDGSGMFSTIERKEPCQRMTFRHLGEVKDGVKIPKDWGDAATEDYRLAEQDGITEVTVVMGAAEGENFTEYLNATFPKALEELKRISEN